MVKSTLQYKLHFLNRTGFGVRPDQLDAIQSIALKDLISNVFTDSSTSVTKLKIVDDNISNVYEKEILYMLPVKSLSPDARREINRQNNEKLRSLTLLWMAQMVNGADQLREKMALFWHGHFACRMENVYFQQNLLDVIRQNALGNFGDLLKAVSKSASMLNFLNNQQNKKAHPNENFAREVMELFTLGRGNYTETDVKEGARAFTGWTYDKNGDFQFNKKTHDEGKKKFLGQTGNFDGDAILDILLKNKQTAFYISQKLYKYFVNDQLDTTNVQWMADRFYASNYDLSALMKDVFAASWFYDTKNIGSRIKSPVDLVVGIQRTLPMKISNEKILLVFNNALGQQPFYPPNVAGWAGGSSWIDSSSLMLRLKIPQLIEDDSTFHINTKVDDDVQMGRMSQADNSQMMMEKKVNISKGYKVSATIDWASVYQPLNDVKRPELFNAIATIVLGPNSGKLSFDAIASKVNSSTRDNYIKTAALALMSTPEYQLC